MSQIREECERVGILLCESSIEYIWEVYDRAN